MPEDHPFWAAPEEPLRVEVESYARNIDTVSLQVIGDKATGETQMINHRVWHAGDDRITGTAPSMPSSVIRPISGSTSNGAKTGYGPDCMIQVSPDGRKFSHRMAPHFVALGGAGGLSWHYPLLGEPSTFYPFAEGDESVKITTGTLSKIPAWSGRI